MLARPKPKPSFLSGAAVSVATIVLSLLAIDKAAEMYLPDPDYQLDGGLMFFSEGAVFQNKSWGGFLYEPNAQITARTIYITNPGLSTAADEYHPITLVDEYAYQITTNSAGLVQLADINSTKPAIIFLGDSFTEGQGASPWFYELERRWPKTSSYQIINGGIFGTGFEAWERLYNSLLSTAKIEKIVIIFISGDWGRPIWQISQHDLECIQSPSRCDGTNKFYGLFHDPAEAEAEIHGLAVEHVKYVVEKKRQQNIFRASAIYQRLLKPGYLLWSPFRTAESEAQFERSKTAIQKMAGAVGAKNILFIHLPGRGELASRLDYFSKRGRDFIRQSGFSFVDGFKECQLTISDYHTHDGHPNAAGYHKIENCIERSVKESFPPV